MDAKYLEYCTTDHQRRCVQAYIDAGCSSVRASEALGIDGGSLRSVIRVVRARAARCGYSPEHGINTPLPDGYGLKGFSRYQTTIDENGNKTGQWIKTEADKERQLELMREAVEAMSEGLPRIKPRIASRSYNDDLFNIIPMGDPHFGLYCWADEVGNDFDLNIARRDLCGAVDWLVSQAPPAPKCLIINLGDYFHADNLQGVTSRSGHVLDMDTRLPKVIRVGVSALRQAITTALTRHQTVEIVNAIGNHDDVLSMALSIMLANIYEHEPRVVVHDQPTRRHYVRHGKVLIGVTHGHQTKDSALPGIMATERPSDWGETRHRYFYRGHHHQTAVSEYPGCTVEQFRTLAPGDAYAVGSGYLSGRDMKMITHHREYGEVARTTCSIDLLRSLGVG